MLTRTDFNRARSSEELGNTSGDVAKRWHYWEIRVSLKTAISFFVLGVKIPNVPLVSWQPVKKEKKMCVKKKKKKTMDLEKYSHWSKAITDLISRQSLTFH